MAGLKTEKPMKAIRMLIVEDDQKLLRTLEADYRSILESCGFHVTIEKAETVEEARRLAKAAMPNPYDLVSLDVILGDPAMTGLHVLETLYRFQSAWMVALLTGAETDATVDRRMGKARGDSIRKQLRRDAYARFPAERLLVVEKPSAIIPPPEAAKLLANRLRQIAAVYEEVSRLRYIFRPIKVKSLERVPGPKAATANKPKRRFIETTSLHWQIRFNCGEIRTLPDKTGFKTLHQLLSLEPEQSLTPEDAMVIEPRNETDLSSDATQPGGNPVAEYFNALGIAWETLTPQRKDEVGRAALSPGMKRYVELRGFQDEDDLSPEEEDELARIKRGFGPLADMAETAYQRVSPKEDSTAFADEPTIGALAQDGLHAPGGNYDRRAGGRGKDAPAAMRFRTRKKRICDCLRENGFTDFAAHVEAYVSSLGASWSYNPPPGIEWTTSAGMLHGENNAPTSSA
jgi:CheY-like chemotaxis protein